MPDINYVYTREERENLTRAKQDIDLFLRLASQRLENDTIHAPFKRTECHGVISWLRALANRYGNGEDITK